MVLYMVIDEKKNRNVELLVIMNLNFFINVEFKRLYFFSLDIYFEGFLV